AWVIASTNVYGVDGWGKPDTISILSSAHKEADLRAYSERQDVSEDSEVPVPPYFTRDIPPKYISIIQNDWPYSVPIDIEHTLIWTRVPIYHPEIVDPSIAARIAQDGIWGFTGLISPPPSPSMLPSCLPALSEWGVTEDKMIISPKGTPEEEALVEKVGVEVNEFVKRRWNEDEWETAWFVNPPSDANALIRSGFKASQTLRTFTVCETEGSQA
ncbi:hypothetical protein MPER_07200, partial [Moniliophthora perniciosa FA553]